MWRSILLGKLLISIIASLIVCGICFRISRGAERTVAESGQWMLLSVFFLGLSVCFAIVIGLLFYRKKR
jgi:phosphotransferase system  glucose/maltose/N-acetylglucosamine-specific IIC component